MHEIAKPIPTFEESGKFKNNKFECYMLEQKTLYLHYFRNSVIDKEDTVLMLKIGKQISPSDDTKVIVHMEKYVDVKKDAREYIQNNLRTLKAEAHVIPSLAYKIVFNIFFKLRKNKHPLKAFDTLDDAIVWIGNI
ncbi:hypothetical protein N8987_00640 [Crocinitomix sp.]|nr:hypothetical protein [Crocinitomix sp.]